MDAHLADVISRQDAVLLGRGTYDDWSGYWPSSPHPPSADFINGVAKHVVTSTPLYEPVWANNTAVEGPLEEVVQRGVDVVVEVAPGPNAEPDLAVVAPGATIAVYAVDGAPKVTLPVRPHMVLGTRWQFVSVYTVPRATKLHAVSDVSAAVTAGILPVGESVGLPLHRFTLADTAAAHGAVERHVVGKLLVDLAPNA